MTPTIPELLLDTGILQFGYFVTDDSVSPVRFCPEYLPAYPDLLAQVTKLALSHLKVSEIDHLLTTAESVPLGVACSLLTGLSLVYSRGKGEAVVYDLVGSYNSGHKAALLIYSLENEKSTQQFVSNAQLVGLETRMIVSLIDWHMPYQQAEIPVQTVFRLANVVQELAIIGRLPERQAQIVLDWMGMR